jgi:hypothetical protein
MTTRRMPIASLHARARAHARTHSEYVILIAFPLKLLLQECAAVFSYTYIAYFVPWCASSWSRQASCLPVCFLVTSRWSNRSIYTHNSRSYRLIQAEFNKIPFFTNNLNCKETELCKLDVVVWKENILQLSLPLFFFQWRVLDGCSVARRDQPVTLPPIYRTQDTYWTRCMPRCDTSHCVAYSKKPINICQTQHLFFAATRFAS